MWREIAEWVQKVLRLKEQSDQHGIRIVALEEEVGALSQAVIDLQYQLLKNSVNERHEREKLAMRLEIVLLRFERALGPGTSIVPDLSSDEDIRG